MPAGVPLLAGADDCVLEGVVLRDEDMVGVFEGDGVKGVEKGWAAEVDVAGGGFSGLWREGVVVMVRRREKKRDETARRWLQRVQIIVVVTMGRLMKGLLRLKLAKSCETNRPHPNIGQPL